MRGELQISGHCDLRTAIIQQMRWANQRDWFDADVLFPKIAAKETADASILEEELSKEMEKHDNGNVVACQWIEELGIQSNLVTMPPRYYATLVTMPLLLGPDKFQYKINLLCHPLPSLLCHFM